MQCNIINDKAIIENTSIIPSLDKTNEANAKPDGQNVDIQQQSSSSSCIIVKKKRGNPNLKPRWKKGESGNPKGKPKGTIQIKDVLRKKLNKENANQIVDTLIKGSIAGEDKKTEVILKLNGELNENSNVNITNQSLTISQDLLDAARQYLLGQEQSKPIIDINTDNKQIKE